MWGAGGSSLPSTRRSSGRGVGDAVRIVIASPTLPLPFAGADGRWLHAMVSGLVARGVEVSCVSCSETANEMVIEAQDWCSSIRASFAHVPMEVGDKTRLAGRRANALRPFSELDRVEAFRKAVDAELARGYDIFHIDQVYTASPFGGYPRSALFLHCLNTVDWANRRDLTMRERVVRTQMERAERRILGKARWLVANTGRVAAAARTLGFRGTAAVSPLGIDTSLYQGKRRPGTLTVGLIGSMNWYPSRSAAERLITRLWPRIRQQIPEARLMIAGWKSDGYLGRYFPVDGASLLGEVDDPLEFLRQCDVLLYAPEAGTGVKIKVLEALALGVPVVSNAEGLEGIALPWPDGPISRESDIELIEATVSVLEDSDQATRMAEAGRRLVDQQFAVEVAVDRLLSAYSSLIAGSR